MKRRLGFDFGEHLLHIAVREGDSVVRVVNEPIPEGLVRNKRILSREAMGDLLRETRARCKLRGRAAALVLPPTQCCCRRVRLPYMNAEQLRFNLPFEFRDFMTSGKDGYCYDYAVIRTVEDEKGVPSELDLMAAAAPRELISGYDAMFRRAGFRLRAVVPEEMAYVNLLRRCEDPDHGHCILDLGCSGVRIFLFEGRRYDSVRSLDIGCRDLIRAVAEHFNTSRQMARICLEENRDGAAELPECVSIYHEMAVEAMKAINFYRFSNRVEDGPVHIHCCGGGAANKVLTDTLAKDLALPVKDMSEFWPNTAKNAGADLAAAAVGAAMQ